MKPGLILSAGRFFLIVSLILSPGENSTGQVPQGFNYQAIAHDASGNPITNSTLQVKLAVMADSLGSNVLWEELHNPVNTNAFGLFTIVLGRGVKQAASAVPSFSGIEWSVTPKFVRSQVYYQSSWKTMGTTRMWSVPYAMAARDVSGSLPKLRVAGNTTSMDSALFEVKNKTGQTVFAVYNEGVRIYVDDGDAKGTKGGFAIGSFNIAKAGSRPYFVVSPDSIRGYIDTSKVKRTKGGFAIGGFNTSKGTLSNFMEMTPKNYFIGEESGANNTSGLFNSFIGYQTGKNNTTGRNNAFFGYQSGNSNTSGNSNLFVGYQSGYSNLTGSFNSFMGYQSGFSNTTGANNTYLGSYSGRNNSSGSNNTFVGFYAGYLNTTGTSNSFLGTNSGYNNLSGKSNIFIGPDAGYSNTVGDSNIFVGLSSGTFNAIGRNNTFLGVNSGYRFTTGSNNVCIGYMTGFQSVTTNNNIFIGSRAGRYGINPNPSITIGDGNIWIGRNAGWNLPSLWSDQFEVAFPQRPLENTLVIDQSDGVYPAFSYKPAHYPAGDQNRYPLIFGNFSYEAGRRCVVINGVYSYTYTFFVNGQAGGKTAWANVSDARQKKNVTEIANSLDKILKLRGVNFIWADTLNMPSGRQMGFIAQEAEEVVPEVVTNRGGAYLMSYAPLTALLVEGMKEQQEIIESQKSEIEALKEEIANIKLALKAIGNQ